jgi:thiol:disulfide interchange protein DsbC
MNASFKLVARTTIVSLLMAVACAGASAQEAQIRKNIAERMPDFPKVDEVTKTAIPGVYEIRVGTEVFYTDEQANHVINGSIIDTRTRENLTENRIAKLTAIDFDALPLKDAVTIKQGTGARKLAVFADPNCGYCKQFERDLVNAKDVTVYVFLYPILGPDSVTKSRDIWCSKDAGKTWRDWMIGGKAPVRVMGNCDSSAIERVTEIGRKHRLQGTPALVFEDGTRVPGAIPADKLEKQLVASAKKP